MGEIMAVKVGLLIFNLRFLTFSIYNNLEDFLVLL